MIDPGLNEVARFVEVELEVERSARQEVDSLRVDLVYRDEIAGG